MCLIMERLRLGCCILQSIKCEPCRVRPPLGMEREGGGGEEEQEDEEGGEGVVEEEQEEEGELKQQEQGNSSRG